MNFQEWFLFVTCDSCFYKLYYFVDVNLGNFFSIRDLVTVSTCFRDFIGLLLLPHKVCTNLAAEYFLLFIFKMPRQQVKLGSRFSIFIRIKYKIRIADDAKLLGDNLHNFECILNMQFTEKIVQYIFLANMNFK